MLFKKPHYIALSAVLLFVLVALSLPERTAAQLKMVIGGLFLPLFGLASSAQALGESASARLLPRSYLLERLEVLEAENRELRLKNLEAAQIWRENSELRQALAWQQRSPWNARFGRILLRDPANWWRSVRIDLGTRDGLMKDLPVLSSDGLALVGRVNEVGFGSSQILLLGDPNCRVAAKVERTSEHGVVAPGSETVLDPSIVQLAFLPAHSQVKPGDSVVTSGWGGLFPEGLRIGTIIDTNSFGYGMYTEARIKLAADLSRLEEVWVLLP